MIEPVATPSERSRRGKASLAVAAAMSFALAGWALFRHDHLISEIEAAGGTVEGLLRYTSSHTPLVLEWYHARFVSGLALGAFILVMLLVARWHARVAGFFALLASMAVIGFGFVTVPRYHRDSVLIPLWICAIFEVGAVIVLAAIIHADTRSRATPRAS